MLVSIQLPPLKVYKKFPGQIKPHQYINSDLATKSFLLRK